VTCSSTPATALGGDVYFGLAKARHLYIDDVGTGGNVLELEGARSVTQHVGDLASIRPIKGDPGTRECRTVRILNTSCHSAERGRSLTSKGPGAKAEDQEYGLKTRFEEWKDHAGERSLGLSLPGTSLRQHERMGFAIEQLWPLTPSIDPSGEWVMYGGCDL
jgi:hypothetical protein